VILWFLIFSLVVPALPPRRQQSHRPQFLIRFHIKINALLALAFFQMFGEAEDVGASEFLAGHKVARTFENDSNFFRQLVASIFVGHRAIVAKNG